nr:MAG TPA: hypothetical protein [Caudoviricetes sp.]
MKMVDSLKRFFLLSIRLMQERLIRPMLLIL